MLLIISASFIVGISFSAVYAGVPWETADIANDAITSEKIKNQDVRRPDIRNNAISSAKINNGAVQSVDIRDGTIQGVGVVAIQVRVFFKEFQ